MVEINNPNFENQSLAIESMEIVRNTAVRKVEKLITDDPHIRLEYLTSEQLQRVQLHFVGGMHAAEFEERWSEVGARRKPDYIIQEGGTPTAAERRSAELVENLELRKIPISVVSSTDNKVYRLNSELVNNGGWHNVAKSAAKQRRGQPPVFRLMDLAHDEHPEVQRAYSETYGTQPANAHKTLLLMTGLDRPLDEVMSDFKQATVADVAFNVQREQRMIDDISIIVGNAIKRQPTKDISIVILHGGYHTALYQYFHNLGIPTSREFISSATQHPREKWHFNQMSVVDREAQFRGHIHDKSAIAAIVGRMVGVAARKQRSTVDTEQVAESLSNTDIAGVQEAWEERDTAYAKRFSTAKRRAASETHLEQTLRNVAARHM